MPRLVYLLGVGVALVALALTFTDWTLSFRPGVKEQNVKRIRRGMRLAAAEAILGRKADCRFGHLEGKHPAGTAEVAYWEEADGPVLVWLDCEGRVIDKLSHRQTEERNPLTLLRAWFGR